MGDQEEILRIRSPAQVPQGPWRHPCLASPKEDVWKVGRGCRQATPRGQTSRHCHLPPLLRLPSESSAKFELHSFTSTRMRLPTFPDFFETCTTTPRPHPLEPPSLDTISFHPPQGLNEYLNRAIFAASPKQQHTIANFLQAPRPPLAFAKRPPPGVAVDGPGHGIHKNSLENAGGQYCVGGEYDSYMDAKDEIVEIVIPPVKFWMKTSPHEHRLRKNLPPLTDAAVVPVQVQDKMIDAFQAPMPMREQDAKTRRVTYQRMLEALKWAQALPGGGASKMQASEPPTSENARAARSLIGRGGVGHANAQVQQNRGCTGMLGRSPIDAMVV